jgi:hypothetical protein
MPDAAWHVAKASRFETFLDAISPIERQHPEWAVIVHFYTALHYVDGFYATKGIPVSVAIAVEGSSCPISRKRARSRAPTGFSKRSLRKLATRERRLMARRSSDRSGSTSKSERRYAEL